MNIQSTITVTQEELIRLLELASYYNCLTRDSLKSTIPTEDSTEDYRTDWESAVRSHNCDNLLVLMKQRQLGYSPLEDHSY